MRTTSTTTDESRRAPADEQAPLIDWLVVARAPEPDLVGHRLIASGLVVGRTTREMFREDRSLSREHASFVETPDGLEVVDLESHNGVRVGGTRIERQRLQAGDYIEIGRFGFVLARAPAERRLATDAVLIGDSHSFQLALSALDALAQMRSPALVYGPPGSGRTTFCERIHARSGREKPLVWLDARVTDDLRDALTGPDGAIDAAAGGTLVLEAIDALSGAARELVPAAVATAERVDCRLLFTANHADALAETPFASAWRVELPPLSARRDDIPLLAARIAASHGARFELSAEEQAWLMTHAYAANIRELALVVERIVRAPAELRPSIFARLRERAPTPAQTIVAKGGSWFTADDARIDLTSSKKLVAVLAALVDAHLEGQGHVGVETLAALGWPGEKILPRAARNRVYVAISTLRRMGLRAIAGQPGSGYALDGDFAIAD